MNNSFKEIAQQLLDAKTILLYPHVNMDGDALGSCAALCRALRLKGKQAYILIEDEIPFNLKFLDKGYCTCNSDVIKDVDISMCVDCGDISRFEMRKDKFLQGKISICVDHHRSSKIFCDYNYIDSNACAAGELVYFLIKELEISKDKEIGEALFSAITTDTGNFQYSNTTGISHKIMVDLYDWGIDANKASVEIYENMRLEKLLIKSLAISKLIVVGEGKGAITYVTQDMLKETGATMDETEGIVEDLRCIAGVEYAVLLKEHEPAKIKVSLRAKREGDVASIAEKLGGGGHTKAAGCTLNMSLEKALETIKSEIQSSIGELKGND